MLDFEIYYYSISYMLQKPIFPPLLHSEGLQNMENNFFWELNFNQKNQNGN
jgi:hypothetical protein